MTKEQQQERLTREIRATWEVLQHRIKELNKLGGVDIRFEQRLDVDLSTTVNAVVSTLRIRIDR